MNKIVGLLVTIIIISIGCARNVRSDELIIIDNEVVLNNTSDNNSKELLKLRFLDTVKIVNSTEQNGKIKALTDKGVEGWIDVKKTNYIPNDWMWFNEIGDVKLALPKNMKFKFVSGKENISGRLRQLYHHRLWGENYFIVINKYLIEHDDYFKKDIESLERGTKLGMEYRLEKFNVNNISGYIILTRDDESGYDAFLAVLKGKSSTYSISVIMQNETYSHEIGLIAKKILFSAQLKE